jgi:hypothetical protein
MGVAGETILLRLAIRAGGAPPASPPTLASAGSGAVGAGTPSLRQVWSFDGVLASGQESVDTSVGTPL